MNRRSTTKRAAFIVCVGLFCTSGCGSKPTAVLPSDVTAPVYALADGAERPARFQKLFAAGAVPNETQRKRFADLMYAVADVKSRTDAEAVLHVLIRDGQGRQVGEADWTVVQEGGAWKLKTATLP